MAEGFDDFEMEKFEREYPEYDDLTEDDINYNLTDLVMREKDLSDYNPETREELDDTRERIEYLTKMLETKFIDNNDGKTVTIKNGNNTSVEVSRVESVLDSTGMRILMRGKVSELNNLFTNDGRIDGRKTKEFKEFKQFLTRYLEKVFRLNGPLLIDLNTSKELIAKTRFENVGKIQEGNRAITLIYNGEEVVTLKVQSKPYNFEVINENLFKKIEKLVESNNNFRKKIEDDIGEFGFTHEDEEKYLADDLSNYNLEETKDEGQLLNKYIKRFKEVEDTKKVLRNMPMVDTTPNTDDIPGLTPVEMREHHGWSYQST